jgi:transcription-repair coupling factor (superfamily II helicase)
MEYPRIGLVRNISGGEQITVERAYADLKNPAQAAQRENDYRPIMPYVMAGAVVLGLIVFTALVIVSHLDKTASPNGSNHKRQRQPDTDSAPVNSFKNLSVGDSVLHPKFGRGKLVKIVVYRGKPLYQVQFDGAAGKAYQAIRQLRQLR